MWVLNDSEIKKLAAIDRALPRLSRLADKGKKTLCVSSSNIYILVRCAYVNGGWPKYLFGMEIMVKEG